MKTKTCWSKGWYCSCQIENVFSNFLSCSCSTCDPPIRRDFHSLCLVSRFLTDFSFLVTGYIGHTSYFVHYLQLIALTKCSDGDTTSPITTCLEKKVQVGFIRDLLSQSINQSTSANQKPVRHPILQAVFFRFCMQLATRLLHGCLGRQDHKLFGDLLEGATEQARQN